MKLMALALMIPVLLVAGCTTEAMEIPDNQTPIFDQVVQAVQVVQVVQVHREVRNLVKYTVLNNNWLCMIMTIRQQHIQMSRNR